MNWTWHRKKRKWDQPAESLVSVGVAVSGALQCGNMGSLGGISLPGAASVSGALLTNPLVASSSPIPPVFPVPSIGQSTAAAISKSNQVRYFVLFAVQYIFYCLLVVKLSMF